jgi:hypothetical protein
MLLNEDRSSAAVPLGVELGGAAGGEPSNGA